MPSDERDIRDAEQAKLRAVVAELGTEAERDELEFVSALAGLGVPVWEGGEKVGSRESLRRLLARLVRRAERRARLQLPRVRCAGSPANPVCACLQEALDEPGDGGKGVVLKLAASLHWSPPPRVESRLDQEEKPAAPLPRTQVRKGEPPRPPAKPEPPFRVVRRRPKWYDPPSFFDTKF